MHHYFYRIGSHIFNLHTVASAELLQLDLEEPTLACHLTFTDGHYLIFEGAEAECVWQFLQSHTIEQRSVLDKAPQLIR